MALGNPLTRLQQAFRCFRGSIRNRCAFGRRLFARFDAAGAVAYSVLCNGPEHLSYQALPIRSQPPSQRLLECCHRLKCPLKLIIRGCLSCASGRLGRHSFV